jgi:poly(3-hydroxybutyrate) depolymerase
MVRIGSDNPIFQSVGVCMQNPAVAQIRPDVIQENQKNHLISSTDNIAQQKVFLYQGSGDTVVHPPMLEKLKDFYHQFHVPDANIKISQGPGGHNFPTDHEGENDCSAQEVPYVSSCGMDVAGDLLKHVTGHADLQRSMDRDQSVKNLYQVSQDLGADSSVQRPSSIATYGYLAASPACLANPEQCDVHVALHGCKMSDSFDDNFDNSLSAFVKQSYMKAQRQSEALTGMSLPYPPLRKDRYGTLKFALDAGYLDYVEKNKLIVLFPQTWISPENYPLNPKGCWDWYGWTGSNYATNQGAEASWLMAWIQQIRKNPKAFIGTDANGVLQPKPLKIQEAREL